MKRAFLCVVCLAASAVLADEDLDFVQTLLASQATPRTQEATSFAPNGTVKGVSTTQDYDVHIKQTRIVEKKADKNGVLRVAREMRTTEINDLYGGSQVVREDRSGLTGPTASLQVVEEIRTPAYTLITVQKKNKEGALIITQRTTQTKQSDGTQITEVETPNAEGILTVTQRQVVTQRRTE